MSSSRFPGKVLTNFLDRPIIRHIVEAVDSVPAIDRVVVLTSDDQSDEPLVTYLESIGCAVFRGPLLDVFERFRLASRTFPSEWVLRLCGDSPLLSPNVVAEVASHAVPTADWDLVTTRFSPPFPKGQNAELIRTQTLLEVDSDQLTSHDREHVTPWFYRNRDRYKIADAAPVDLDLPGNEFTVDTPDDLARLERLLGR